MPCESCGDRAVSRYCDFCDRLYFKDEKLRERQAGPRKKVVRKRPAYDDRVCEDCKVSFKPKGRIQTRCTPCNKKWNNRTPGEKWLARKPHKNARDSNQVAYAFFRKKYSVPNNVFRG